MVLWIFPPSSSPVLNLLLTLDSASTICLEASLAQACLMFVDSTKDKFHFCTEFETDMSGWLRIKKHAFTDFLNKVHTHCIQCTLI